MPHVPKVRRGSTISVDYFDPEGVSTLSKSLDPAVETHSSGQTTSGDWQTTLKEGAEIPFDFEQTLRDYIKKSISFVLYIASPSSPIS